MAMHRSWGSPTSLAWSGGPAPCDEAWTGVYCTGEVVTSIDVSTYSNVNGPVDPAIGQLSGLIRINFASCNMIGFLPPQISLLSALTYLSLGSQSFNSIGGFTGPIPVQFSGLTNLVELYLNANNLNSTIPAQLSKLTALKNLYMDDNLLTGSLPPALSSLYASIGKELHVYSNGALCGSITSFPNIQTVYTQLGQDCPPPPRELPVLHTSAATLITTASSQMLVTGFGGPSLKASVKGASLCKWYTF